MRMPVRSIRIVALSYICCTVNVRRSRIANRLKMCRNVFVHLSETESFHGNRTVPTVVLYIVKITYGFFSFFLVQFINVIFSISGHWFIASLNAFKYSNIRGNANAPIKLCFGSTGHRQLATVGARLRTITIISIELHSKRFIIILMFYDGFTLIFVFSVVFVYIFIWFACSKT